MREAIAAAGRTRDSGDVPIGAVVLDAGGTVIGTGYNTCERDGTALGHAELHALEQAARATGDKFLTGATLVVTVEPCTMCAGAAVLSRVQRIVFGSLEPKTGAVVSLWDVVRDARLNHRVEVFGPWDLPAELTAECTELMQGFFRDRR